MLVTALATQLPGVGDKEGITLFWSRLLEYNGKTQLFFINKNTNSPVQLFVINSPRAARILYCISEYNLSSEHWKHKTLHWCLLSFDNHVVKSLKCN